MGAITTSWLAPLLRPGTSFADSGFWPANSAIHVSTAAGLVTHHTPPTCLLLFVLVHALMIKMTRQSP